MMRRLIDGFQAAALLSLGAVAFVYFGPALDKLFPVVHPFFVSSKSVSQNQITIAGWLHKKRDCEFLEASGLVVRNNGAPLVVPLEFLDARRIYTRPTGTQEWGPWRMAAPVGTETVKISALHNCHPLWRTRSELATIEVKP